MKKPRNNIFLGYCLFYLVYIGVTIWGWLSGTFSEGLLGGLCSGMVVLLGVLLPVYVFSHNHTVAKAAKIAHAALPEIETPATLINKTQKTVGDHYSTGTVFYVAFELPDGDRKNFKVDSDTYATVEKGDTGMLTYKEGGKYRFFVRFKRQINND